MEKLHLLLLAMLLRVNLTESCKKSKPHVVYQNVTPEEDSKLNQSDIALNDTKEEFYDYGDMTATVDEDHLEEDDSSDAFDDAEDDELCAEVTDEPQYQELPEAVIIGTKKGGTRALLEFLNIHSQVKRAKNEIHFYDKQYERGLEWYIQQMPSVTRRQMAVEKTPGYFHTRGVARRLWAANNKTKLIVIMRHPVTRLISDYNQFRSNKLGRGETFPDLESLVLNRYGDAVDASYPPVARSLYHLHMARWLQLFPASQIHVVDGDKFIQAPWTELVKLETFLGLEPQLDRDNFYFNTSKGFYCGRQEVPRPGSEWSCVRTKCLSASKGRPRPAVSPATVSLLTEFFLPHNRKFYAMVGRSFDWDTEP